MMTVARVIVAALLIHSAHSANEANMGEITSVASVEAMAEVFARSEQTHAESMAAIMKSMSTDQAWQVLDKNNLTDPALVNMKTGLIGKQVHLRKQPKGYAGLE